jgi:4-hydroxy-2-oxoheptanedioate aldolase
MIKNKVKQAWAAGKPAINGWLGIGDPFTAEVMASAGFDSLTIDVQHGFLDYGDARSMLQAMRASGVVAFARPPWAEPGIVMKLLDAGAFGIICPMVNTAQEAADLVAMVRYPPHGQRSYGPTRAMFIDGNYPTDQANDEVIVIAMIETREAYENIDAICSTPGLNGVYIGPADLGLGLSNGALRPAQDRLEPEMVDAFKHICAAAKKAGISAGIHCATPDYAARAVGWGFDLVTVATDVSLLADGARQAVSRGRDLIGDVEIGDVGKS